MKHTALFLTLFVALCAATFKQDVLEVYPDEITSKNCAFGVIQVYGKVRYIGCDACKAIPDSTDTQSDVEIVVVFRNLFFGIPIIEKHLIIPLED